MAATDAPILLFDSGVGGLSVLAELRKLLPDAPVIYAADNAGLPYGGKTEAEIVQAAWMESPAGNVRAIPSLPWERR